MIWRKIRKYLTYIIILLFVVIVIDNKNPHVFQSRMSAKNYQHFHNVLLTIQLKSKKGVSNIIEGIENGKNELLDSQYKDIREVFVSPMKEYRITSDYGFRLHPVFYYPEKHKGVDMACSEENPVCATYSGIVSDVGEKRGNGIFVKLNHNNGFSSAYLHLQSYCVKKGQKVSTGQQIGKSGNTGTSTGPHLHFALKKDGRYINPNYIIDFK